MGRPSLIESNPVLLKAVNQALARGGVTIDDITQMLDEMGHEIGRSSVGRQTKKLKDMARRARDIRAAADAFAANFGDMGDNQTKLMVQLIVTIITEKLADSPQGESTPLEIQRLASAVKDAIGAQKIDTELRARIRRDAHEEGKAAAERALASTGATQAQIEALRREFLGLRA